MCLAASACVLALPLGTISDVVVDQSTNREVVQQVSSFPSWLLPLWANWPLILLGIVGLVVLIYGMKKFIPILTSLQALTQKVGLLSDQMGYVRRETFSNLQSIRRDLDTISHRVDLVERHMNLHNSPLREEDPKNQSGEGYTSLIGKIP